MRKSLCSTCQKPLLTGNEFFGLHHFKVQDATNPDTTNLRQKRFCSAPCLIEYLIKNTIDEDSLWAFENGFNPDLWLRDMIKRVTEIMAKMAADKKARDKKARNGAPHHIYAEKLNSN